MFGVLWTFLIAVEVLGLVFCVGCFCVFMPLSPPSSLVRPVYCVSWNPIETGSEKVSCDMTLPFTQFTFLCRDRGAVRIPLAHVLAQVSVSGIPQKWLVQKDTRFKAVRRAASAFLLCFFPF